MGWLGCRKQTWLKRSLCLKLQEKVVETVAQKRWFLMGTLDLHADTECQWRTFILSYQNALDLSSLKILKGSVFRVSTTALLELANRLSGVTDLRSDWMWFKSRSNLWPYCLCSPSQWFKPLITLAIHWNRSEPCFFSLFPKCRANHGEQYSPQSLAALATLHSQSTTWVWHPLSQEASTD